MPGEPRDALVGQALSVWLKAWQQDGGDPYYPRHQRRLLREAGFVRPVGYATADCFGTPERTRLLADLFVALAEQPAFVRTAEAQGWADAATQAALRAAGAGLGRAPGRVAQEF